MKWRSWEPDDSLHMLMKLISSLQQLDYFHIFKVVKMKRNEQAKDVCQHTWQRVWEKEKILHMSKLVNSVCSKCDWERESSILLFQLLRESHSTLTWFSLKLFICVTAIGKRSTLGPSGFHEQRIGKQRLASSSLFFILVSHNSKKAG